MWNRRRPRAEVANLLRRRWTVVLRREIQRFRIEIRRQPDAMIRVDLHVFREKMKKLASLIHDAHHLFQWNACLASIQFDTNTQTIHCFLPESTAMAGVARCGREDSSGCRSIAMRKLCQASRHSGATSRMRSQYDAASSASEFFERHRSETLESRQRTRAFVEQSLRMTADLLQVIRVDAHRDQVG